MRTEIAVSMMSKQMLKLSRIVEFITKWDWDIMLTTDFHMITDLDYCIKHLHTVTRLGVEGL